MDLENLRMLIHEMLNKDPSIVPESAPIIVLDSKSAVCMDNNDKDTKYTSHIYRKVNVLRYGEKCKWHKIGWCEGDCKLEETATKNVGDNDLNPRIKYITVMFDNV